jgi:predicted nucleotidyltransferase
MGLVTQPIWAVTPEKISEAVRRIVDAAKPRKVIVFGSQARGDGGEDSDLDLMVVTDVVENQMEESIRLRRLLNGLIMAVNILVVRQEKFDYWCDTPGNVFYEAKQEGKVVYEAA